MSHCICWTGPPVLHQGHCCFGPLDEGGGWDYDRDVIACGHEETGLPAWRESKGTDLADLIGDPRS